MAFTASTPTNRITRTIVPGKSIFPDATYLTSTSSTLGTYNQGDLMIYDSTNFISRAIASTDSESTVSAYFLGISPVTINSGKLASPYYGTAVDASSGDNTIVGPQFAVIASLALKTGSTLSPGSFVYLDPSDGAYFVQPSGTVAIGVYQGPAISGSAAGVFIEVQLGQTYLSGALSL